MRFYFENHAELTEARIVETVNSIKWLAFLRWMMVVLLGVATVVLIVVMIGAEKIDASIIMPLILAPLSSVVLAILPQLCAKLEMRVIRKKHGGVVPASITWFGKEISTNDGDGRQYAAYSQITAIRMFHDYFAIFLDHFTILILSYDGFTQGSFQEFKQFLRQKRPDLKIPE